MEWGNVKRQALQLRNDPTKYALILKLGTTKVAEPWNSPATFLPVVLTCVNKPVKVCPQLHQVKLYAVMSIKRLFTFPVNESNIWYLISDFDCQTSRRIMHLQQRKWIFSENHSCSSSVMFQLRYSTAFSVVVFAPSE
jgi:hypothetical protein